MVHDVIIVGGGIAGLTAASFLARTGHSVLLFEKNKKTGGLVNSFSKNGFIFDGGIRATENSGVLFPMLNMLGIDIRFIKNKVSIGFKKDIIRLDSMDSLEDYKRLLKKYFESESDSIDSIIAEIKKTMKYMEILYGIDNPIFLDLKKDRRYLIKEILPWIFKYMLTVNKIERLKVPIEQYLKRFTDDISLLDMISQHFFKSTPAFFALGYLNIYIDYYYPEGGTGILTQSLNAYASDKGASIRCNTEITYIDPNDHIVKDSKGNSFNYKKLIWAADLKMLYESIDETKIKDPGLLKSLLAKREDLSKKKGGESVLTVYLGLDMDKEYFSDISTEHFFYTPNIYGISQIDDIEDYTKNKISEWLKGFLNNTTYEISIPALRDKTLAPEGKTGLIISTLFEYNIIEKVLETGWYSEFKQLCEKIVIDVLNKSIYPGIDEKILLQFSSTPHTMKKLFNNSDGAITGWSFENDSIPVESRLIKIASAPTTLINDIFQAGQWAYSPSGLPTSIMTGKMAADKALKQL